MLVDKMNYMYKGKTFNFIKCFSISGDLVEDIFEETPRMSTYLVAFIVSDFKNLSTLDNNLSYHIWVREDALTQADYSVSISPGIIQFMENFTEIDFEMNKLDQAAIPDFSAGAMENWGLVTYRSVPITVGQGSIVFTQTIIFELSY
jgi:aminopeptidase N